MVVIENIIRVYDKNMNKLAYLNNAYDISYDLALNELWYASFSLPADDTKIKYCQPFNYVEIYDGKERIELFRIMPSKLTRNTKGNIVYECEHVLASLLDDVMFQYHQVGNLGVSTTQSIRYVLDKQINRKWQLGQCDFNRFFEYKWENENLLAALFSIAKPLENYKWEFDTTGKIWRIHLRKLSDEVKSDIVYKKNMLEIQKIVDPTTIVTRLYCLGYGEGDNQLDIKSVNNGVPYLESNVTTWGIKTSILVDRRFENPETLKAYGQRLLDELENPYKSYTVNAVDLYRKSPEKYGKFRVGDIVRVVDKEDNIIEDLPIVKILKSDITGNVGEIKIEIANKSRDISGSMSELQDRTRINEVYAQGATNLLQVPFADNADNNNPAILKVYIPSEMAKINKLILNYQLEPFRAYSKAVEGGGAIATSTTSGGGGYESTTSGGGGYESTENAMINLTSTDSGGGDFDTNTGIQVIVPGISQDYTVMNGEHNHGIKNGTELMKADGGTTWFYESGNHSHDLYNHGHRVDIPSHTHSIDMPSHSHDITIPPHSHSVSIKDHNHDINIPNHTHSIQQGIYQGSTADKVDIKVDGKVILKNTELEEIDIIKHLSTDRGGKIDRNTWHTIEIIPNKLTRIVANVFMQIFTNSRGGGDY